MPLSILGLGVRLRFSPARQQVAYVPGSTFHAVDHTATHRDAVVICELSRGTWFFTVPPNTVAIIYLNCR